MYKFHFLLLCCFYSVLSAQSYHENHEVFGVNKLAPHAEVFPFETEALALQNAKEHSRWYQSLNGLWKFKWVKKPADKPADFQAINFDDRAWQTFPVPAN
ncbi:MAG: hypothetical protein AB8G22_28745, partial [Saprospiraceae bacterium]